MDAKEIEAKVFATPVPQVTRVALAYSGGLDSSLCVELLRRVYKVKNEDIVAITCDVGQGAEEVAVGEAKAKVLGIKPIMIDVRKDFTENWLAKAIRANSDYEGYPVSTSMTRQLVAREVALKAVEMGCDALMEGSTGKGNDQYRMHNTFKMFAPKCQILAPVRDFDMVRAEERALCEAWGVPVDEQIEGGDDKTMWCRSIASGAIGLDQELPDDVWMWLVPPQKAPDKTETISVTFEQGVPTKLNGRAMPLGELIPELNVTGGRNGIGRIDMFEDGIMDLKSREIYEAPAAHIILKLHKDLEQFCLTKDEIEFKAMVDRKWAYLTYHGMWYHPLRRELDAFVLAASRFMNGTYKVGLYKGNIEILKRESPSSLFSPEIRSIKAKGFSQRMAKDAATIRGLPFEILAKRGQIEG
ncbi:MAG: argininosuccinate synthase [Acidobacteria bacterium]|nr:argininosuccinate synthase [Planctomycetota bacterium]MBE3134954.1 argininosuccinate synthase [Acidobacteriota bacterium]